jgi:TPR repeat protein
MELLERLRAYEKGNRAKRIQVNDPTFFDLGTGEPIVWYYKSKGGLIELFDLMGFHPESGDELIPITKEIVELWKKQLATRVPTPVDLTKFAPFDPKTGEPRVWYWRSDKGDWIFYDSPGFHPATGEPLNVFTKEATEKFRIDAVAQQKRSEDERLQREKETRERTEKENKEKFAREAKEQEDIRIREAQRQAETGAASRCDGLAGNPTDPKRSGDGATYELLKSQASEAVAACQIAVRQSPNEPRFQYELGGALQFVDRKRSFEIQQKLVNLHYPAAYDNLGWLFYADRKNIPEAVNLFRKGTQFGDPDSMVSLAEMIDRRHATPMSEDETKMALYGRAAAMGHPAAVRALQVEQEKEVKEEQQRLLQQQQQQIMLQILGGVVQNLGRR